MKRKSLWPGILPSMCRRLTWCLACSLALISGTAAGEVHITDDMGSTIALNAPAQRVIALYGAFNEIIASLGEENRLIARTDADTLPLSILEKPSIGTHMRPNPELIIGLRPELVIQLAGREDAVETARMLKSHGIITAVFRMDSFADLFSATLRIGELTGRTQEAKKRVASIQQDLASIQTSWPVQKPSVFFEARYPNLLAAGTSSITSEIIHCAGGVNAVSAPEKLVRLNEEEVLRLRPTIYLIQKGAMNPAPHPLNEREHFKTLDCLRTNQIFVVDQQLFSRPGPRSIQAVRELNAIILAADKGIQP